MGMPQRIKEDKKMAGNRVYKKEKIDLLEFT